MEKNLADTLISHQQLKQILGHSLTAAECSQCLKSIKILEPKVGRFWQTDQGEAGIYIAIAGKVRLINSEGNLITTSEVGSSFGECSFFPEAKFAPYSVRFQLRQN